MTSSKITRRQTLRSLLLTIVAPVLAGSAVSPSPKVSAVHPSVSPEYAVDRDHWRKLQNQWDRQLNEALDDQFINGLGRR